MFYRPLLPDGRVAPLPWQVRLFFINANWPLSDRASRANRLFVNSILAIEFVMLAFVLESEYNYILSNRHNLSLVLETMLTSMITTEEFFRIFHMAYKRSGLKDLLAEFYASIYIERTPETAEIYDQLQRNSLPTRICSYTYFTVLFTFFLVPFLGFFNGQKLFPYRMKMHFDSEPIPIYALLLLIAILDGVWVVTNLVAEANIIATLILNLNGRYLILQRELSDLYSHCTRDRNAPRNSVVYNYRKELIRILQKNREFNEFSRRVQTHYSFRIFILMGLSAIMLCVLSFKIVTVGATSKIFTYVLWLLTKVVELVIFGDIGSAIVETTNKMGLAYYQCDWESAIHRSDDARANVELMKILSIAIELNQKPITFSGLNFFRVSLTSVITILQGAGSYFTCLYTLY